MTKLLIPPGQAPSVTSADINEECLEKWVDHGWFIWVQSPSCQVFTTNGIGKLHDEKWYQMYFRPLVTSPYWYQKLWQMRWVQDWDDVCFFHIIPII